MGLIRRFKWLLVGGALFSAVGAMAYHPDPLALIYGGTGGSSRQAGLNNLAGAVTSGDYLRGNGTNIVVSAIQAADVPTLNQSTTGNAATATALASTPSQCTGSQFSTGVAASGNANCSSLPTATASALGVVEIVTSAVSHQWVAFWNGSGVPQTSQPAFSDISGNPTYTQLATNLKTPTIQFFTSSSGTYTTPSSPTPLYIRILMVGGGGGGGGSGTSSGTAGSAGGNTTFGTSLLTAGGGSPASIQAPGAGGAPTLNSPAIGNKFNGGYGSGGSQNLINASTVLSGGFGASSPFGGGGYGGAFQTAGGSAPINTGAGGGGGGSEGNVNDSSGAGGGAGAYIDAIIPNPTTSYTYTVGSGGNGQGAGSNGHAGGNGGSGYIEVIEYYQ